MPQTRDIMLSSGLSIQVAGETYEQCAASLLRLATKLQGLEMQEAALVVEAWFAPPIDLAAEERKHTATMLANIWRTLRQMGEEELARHAASGGHSVDTAEMFRALANAQDARLERTALRKLEPPVPKAAVKDAVHPRWKVVLVDPGGGRHDPEATHVEAEYLRNSLRMLPAQELHEAIQKGIEAMDLGDKPQGPAYAQWTEFHPRMWVNARGNRAHKRRTLARACAAVGWTVEEIE